MQKRRRVKATVCVKILLLFQQYKNIFTHSVWQGFHCQFSLLQASGFQHEDRSHHLLSVKTSTEMSLTTLREGRHSARETLILVVEVLSLPASSHHAAVFSSLLITKSVLVQSSLCRDVLPHFSLTLTSLFPLSIIPPLTFHFDDLWHYSFL